MVSFKEAFSLSSQEVEAATPPGTVQIHREREDAIVHFDVTDDPRDPLNFPTWHKIAALSVASIYAFTANYVGGVIAPAFQLWPVIFPRDPRTNSELTVLIAIVVLFLGAGNIWWVPLSNWMGRRPVLILATLLLTFSTLWCGLATSYDSLLAARAFQGIGGAAADSVAPALVGDMFPVHQRGRAMAVYTIMLVLGPLAGGISGGYIVYQQSWQMLFWVSLALSAVCLVGVIFFVPETLYTRSAPIEGVPHPESEKSAHFGVNEHIEDKRSVAVGEQRSAYQSFTYVQSLGFIKPRGSLVKQVIQPWRTLGLPGTWVVMLHYAGLVGGIVTISTIGPQIVASPPYLWKQNAGLINVGALIGGVVGYIYTFMLADGRLVKKASKTRHGVAEAEDRLPTLFFPLFTATGGLLVFGFCAQNPGHNRWVGLQVGYGMLTFGLMQVPSVGFNYLIDSYHSLAADCFTMVTILRAIIAFAWTFFVSDWVQHRGAAEPFGIFGLMMGVFSLLTIPLWISNKPSYHDYPSSSSPDHLPELTAAHHIRALKMDFCDFIHDLKDECDRLLLKQGELIKQSTHFETAKAKLAKQRAISCEEWLIHTLSMNSKSGHATDWFVRSLNNYMHRDLTALATKIALDNQSFIEDLIHDNEIFVGTLEIHADPTRYTPDLEQRRDYCQARHTLRELREYKAMIDDLVVINQTLIAKQRIYNDHVDSLLEKLNQPVPR
ncbi:hypothetical protein F53441_6061 [Fusarium austroafricanum]|uniref:Major facilitator superfamily (MFS) profile domain-containing protein n=1 Tax=Fusarium austroafricanum TaxID=2364996 RepID=A0A8H4NZ16_9HYPO|nr:hypothetical protein F53441_6061 [Fusarium austroafricanum]